MVVNVSNMKIKVKTGFLQLNCCEYSSELHYIYYTLNLSYIYIQNITVIIL